MVTTTVSLPKLGALAATRAMLGVGVGLLLADRIEPSRRRKIGGILVAVGALSTAPLVSSLIHGIDVSEATAG